MLFCSKPSYWSPTFLSTAGTAVPVFLQPCLSSLKFFNQHYMSLSSPHPVWTSAGSSPTKVAMACVQAKLLSGRYRTQALCSHWQNGDRKCRMSEECSSDEDTTHILQHCPALRPTRDKLNSFTAKYCNTHSIIANIVVKHCHPVNFFVSFYLIALSSQKWSLLSKNMEKLSMTICST